MPRTKRSQPTQPTARAARLKSAIRTAWRELTVSKAGNRRTLVACSGGADSLALVVALSELGRSERSDIVVAHVVHDLRSEAESLADRDLVKHVCRDLALPFIEARVRVNAADASVPTNNAEARARTLRYRALAKLAREHNCPFIATGHHAEDHLETMLMALLRGSGTRGLAGIAERRPLSRSFDIEPSAARARLILIRPLLVAGGGLGKRDAHLILEASGQAWAEDHTNADTSRLRAALRHDVLPLLESIRPGASRKAIAAGRNLRGAADLIDQRMRRFITKHAVVTSTESRCPLAKLANEPPLIIGGVVRTLGARAQRNQGQDRLTADALAPIIKAVREPEPRDRRFIVGSVSITVERTNTHPGDLVIRPRQEHA